MAHLSDSIFDRLNKVPNRLMMSGSLGLISISTKKAWKYIKRIRSTYVPRRWRGRPKYLTGSFRHQKLAPPLELLSFTCSKFTTWGSKTYKRRPVSSTPPCLRSCKGSSRMPVSNQCWERRRRSFSWTKEWWIDFAD